MNTDSFGEQLREYREKHQLSQKALASLIGKSRKTVSRWETLESKPSRDVVSLIADKLNLDNVERNRLLDLAGYTLAPTVSDPPAEEMPKFARTVRGVLDDKFPEAQENKPAYLFQAIPITEKFTGRSSQVATVSEWLQPTRVVTLWGLGGSGKTAITWKVVTDLFAQGELQRRFPDGVIFHSYYGRPATVTALTHIAQSLVPGIDVRNPTSACQQALSSKRALLILDGAEDAEDLRPILDMRGDCGVLITTRDRNDAVQPEHTLALDVLTDTEAVELLQAWGERYAEDEATVRQICALVGNLALAVRLVGIYMAQQKENAADYLTWLQEDLLDALNPLDATTRDKNVRRLLARSVAQVSDDAQAVLTLAGQIAYLPFDRLVPTGALEWQRGRAYRAISQLINFGLLIHGSIDKFEISHALVYRYVRDDALMISLNPRELAEYYSRLIKKHSEPKTEDFYESDLELQHFNAILSYLVELQDWHTINKTVKDIYSLIELKAQAPIQLTFLTWALEAAKQVRDRENEAFFSSQVGVFYDKFRHEQIELKNIAIPHYERALKLYRSLYDKQGEANQLGNIGVAYYRLKQYEIALTYLADAVVISQSISDKPNTGNWLSNIALCYVAQENLNTAIIFYHKALAIARETGETRNEGKCLGGLGLAHKSLAHYDTAIRYLEQAHAIFQDINDRLGQASTLGNLGLVYKDSNDLTKARKAWQHALLIFESINSPAIKRVQELIDELPDSV